MALTEAEELELLELEEEEARAKQGGTIAEPEVPGTGFLSNLSAALKERGGNISKSLSDSTQARPSKALQTAGQIAGGIIDAPLTALSTGYKALEAAPIVGGGFRALEDLSKSGISKYFSATNKIPGIQQSNAFLSEQAAKHPEATKNIEALANIAGIVPVGTVAGATGSAARFAAGATGSAARFAGGKTLQGAGKLIEDAGERAAPLLAKLELKESPLAIDALKTGATKEGRAAMKSAVGSEMDIGREALDDLYFNFNKRVIDENKIVSSALDDMPSIPLDNTRKALEASKVQPRGGYALTPQERAANKKIDDLIESIKQPEQKGLKLEVADGQVEEAFRDAMDQYKRDIADNEKVWKSDPALIIQRMGDIGGKRQNRGDIQKMFRLKPGENMADDFHIPGRLGVDQYATEAGLDMDEMIEKAVRYRKDNIKPPTRKEIRERLEKEQLRGGENTPTSEIGYNQAFGEGAEEFNPLFDAEDVAKFEERAKKGEEPLNPREFVNLRQALDQNIRWDEDPSVKKILENALYNARTTMQNDLIAAAKSTGRPEYESAMQEMAKKLQARDEVLKDIPGQSYQQKIDNIENYIRNLHGIGKTNKAETLKKLDELIGSDYFERSKMAALAKQFGETGEPGLATRHGTGYGATQLAGLSAAAGAASSGHPLTAAAAAIPTVLQSPYFGTRFIGATQKAGKGLQRTASKINPDIANLKRP